MADLAVKLKYDVVFRRALEKKIKHLEILERPGSGMGDAIAERNRLISEILCMCDYNAGLLVPYFFPKYPYEKPLSLSARPFAMSFFALQVGAFVVARTGRQVSKTTTTVARDRINAELFAKYKSLYIVPHMQHLRTYANKYKEMEKAFRFPENTAQNLFYKTYPNGSSVQMVRLLTSPDDIRGLTVDSITIDEAALFDPDFEPELKQCQKASRFPSRYYAGTSLTLDTFLEARFQESSMGTWFIPCPDGKNWINCGDPDDVLRCIKPNGLTCPYTGKLLDPGAGEYVHANQTAQACGFLGFHAPQIIVPDYTVDLVKWLEIYTDFVNYPRAKFLREVMGIPTTEGSREVSLDNLKAMCCLPESIPALEAKARRGFYRHVISGCDWGGSDHNVVDRTKVSYTVHVVIGVTPDNDIDILHMQTYAGMDYRDIANQIIKDHVRLNATIMASDAGVGLAYNTFLRDSGYIKPDKHLILRYTAPNTKLFGQPPAGQGHYNEFNVNKTESITTLFDAIKRVPPRIRCYNWPQAQKNLMDFMNVYRNLVEVESGGQKFRYRRHGSKADDTLHALNFAYVAARVVMNEPLIDDRTVRDRLLQLLSAQYSANATGNQWAGISG